MATSGTYAFSPEIAEICDEAFERCTVDPASLTARHLRSARMSLDLLFSSWANRHVPLWAVDQQTQTVTESQASYAVATGTVGILDAYMLRSGVRTELHPMSLSDYGLFASDTDESLPLGYYFDRTTSPTISLWPLPENSTDTLVYYRWRRLQDTGAAANTLDVPHRWYEAVVAGLAAKLATKFAPEREDGLVRTAEREFLLARTEDKERAPTRFKLRYGRRA